jgi:hypothetical protein
MGSFCRLAALPTDFLRFGFAFFLRAAFALLRLTPRFLAFTPLFAVFFFFDFFFAFRAMFASFRNSRRRRHSGAAPAR